MSHPTYIIGHKNPDADAICSAITYADFKQRQGKEGYIAARCGNSNPRIDTILKKFNQPLPPFIGDVTPRVHDIMVKDIFKAQPGNTCAEALEIIDDHDIRVLPVVSEENHLEGTVSIFQLGSYFIPKVKDPREMRRVHTSISAIIHSLDAKVLNLVNPDKDEEMYVRVGAMDIRSFARVTSDESTPPNQSIIVVGDRWDIQQKSIQMGMRLLVITGGLEVDEEVVSFAKENDVSLIVSPYDSATTSWFIRTASKLERVMSREFRTFGPDEKVSSVKRKVTHDIAPSFMVVDEDNRLLGILSKSDLLKPSPTRLILVDHNELSQAVNGAKDVDIVEIIDHHRLGNPPTSQPILFINDPVGSTCSIVAGLFKRENLTPTPEIAGLLMSGLISDTLNLQSPTSTPRDAELLQWLSGIGGIDPNDLAETIFSSGSVFLSQDRMTTIRSDMKIFEEDAVKFSVSQVEELGFTNFRKCADEIEDALDKVREKESLLFSALLVTDINTQNSLLLVSGSQEVIDQIKYPVVEKDNIFDLQGVVSRKTQLLPYLSGLLKDLGFGS